MDQYTLCAQAFRGFDESYAFHILKDGLGLWDYLDSIKEALAQLFNKKLNDLSNIKVSATLQAEFSKPTPDQSQSTKPYFTTKPFTLLHASQIQEAIEFISQQLAERMDSFEGEGSGWVFHKRSFPFKSTFTSMYL